MTIILERKDLINYNEKFEKVTSRSFPLPIVKKSCSSDMIVFIDENQVHVFKCLTKLGKAGVYTFDEFYETFFRPQFLNNIHNHDKTNLQKRKF